MAARGYELPADVADFAARNWDALNRAVAARMRRVGVPTAMIGMRFWGVDPGAFVRYHLPQFGGNVRRDLDGKPGINVDAAVLDADAPKMGLLPEWRSATLKDRVDAVIAHEFTEVTAPVGQDFHWYAVAHAEHCRLAITDRARAILRAYRLAEGG